VARHEMLPPGNGPAMRSFLRGNHDAIRDVAVKHAGYAKEADAEGLVYAETNHLFIKGFGWHMPEIASLSRPAVSRIACCTTSIAVYTWRTFTGKKWSVA